MLSFFIFVLLKRISMLDKLLPLINGNACPLLVPVERISLFRKIVLLLTAGDGQNFWHVVEKDSSGSLKISEF